MAGAKDVEPLPVATRYHHGDLRQALLDAAVEALGEVGPGALSLRDLARRVGVSHAAPVHHFGDKAGLLTAIAANGFRGLADALGRVRAEGGSFTDVGVGYVEFAVRHRAHFEVMFRPELYRTHDAGIAELAARAFSYLEEPSANEAGGDPATEAAIVTAAWGLVHGVATLWLQGLLPPALGADPAVAARAAMQQAARLGTIG